MNKEITAKQLEDEYDGFCLETYFYKGKESCEGCKYRTDNDCCFEWLLDNFNITRKVQNENN